MMEAFEDSDYTLDDDTFLVSAKVSEQLPHGLMDQDYIHNGKKLINPLDQASRQLHIGNSSTCTACYIG